MAKKRKTTAAQIKSWVFDEMVRRLEAGDVGGWVRPWASTDYGDIAFYNPLTKHVYSGGNVWILAVASMLNGWSDPRFVTFKGIKKAGGHVLKGEKGTKILRPFPIFETEEEARKNGHPEPELLFIRYSYITVFNAEQVEGLEPLTPETELPNGAKMEKGEALDLFNEYTRREGIPVTFKGNRAFYTPSADAIRIPPVESFYDTPGLWGTVFHELGHSTGHPHRLDRPGFGNWNERDYAREELVAELTAVYLTAYSGLEPNTENMVKYLTGWASKGLAGEDFFWASTAADKAVAYILGERA